LSKNKERVDTYKIYPNAGLIGGSAQSINSQGMNTINNENIINTQVSIDDENKIDSDA